MHESAKRLLTCAQLATAHRADRVKTFGDLARTMEVSSATMTNWKSRGVSKEGAIAAESLFGCSAPWLLTGNGAQNVAPAVAETAPPYRNPPPPPPADFADRREASESGWDTLQDLEAMPPEVRDAYKREIHIRAESFKALTRETLARFGSLAAKPVFKDIIGGDESQPQEGGRPRTRSVFGGLDDSATPAYPKVKR